MYAAHHTALVGMHGAKDASQFNRAMTYGMIGLCMQSTYLRLSIAH